jgi:hypothetical protein
VAECKDCSDGEVPYICDRHAHEGVTFGWDPALPGSEKNTCRCPVCKCLHVWAGDAPLKCSSCGVRFNWPGLQVV